MGSISTEGVDLGLRTRYFSQERPDRYIIDTMAKLSQGFTLGELLDATRLALTAVSERYRGDLSAPRMPSFKASDLYDLLNCLVAVPGLLKRIDGTAVRYLPTEEFLRRQHAFAEEFRLKGWK